MNEAGTLDESTCTAAQKLPMGWEEPIESFLAYLELEKGVSKHTVDGYGSDLRQCAVYLNKKRLGDWISIGSDELVKWYEESGKKKK